MIYTPMFEALPDPAATIVRERLAAVLSGQDQSPKYAHLTASDRRAISDILRDTKLSLLPSSQ